MFEKEEEGEASAEKVEEEETHPPQETPSIQVDWWHSGDANRLFAPSDVLYNSNRNVKEIVMERIELLEKVICASQTGRLLLTAEMMVYVSIFIPKPICSCYDFEIRI